MWGSSAAQKSSPLSSSKACPSLWQSAPYSEEFPRAKRTSSTSLWNAGSMMSAWPNSSARIPSMNNRTACCARCGWDAGMARARSIREEPPGSSDAGGSVLGAETDFPPRSVTARRIAAASEWIRLLRSTGESTAAFNGSCREFCTL